MTFLASGSVNEPAFNDAMGKEGKRRNAKLKRKAAIGWD
jgi:hypothetical protein